MALVAMRAGVMKVAALAVISGIPMKSATSRLERLGALFIVT